ncbi:SET and MYND domain-containing protein 4-like isoform X2 [Mercenaria mercenaria]|uniref:SET and MYND domain-containing protein 4-like isoform X2 n=1 Tax=Mercenaria mercenaria TaxID=6596 RepID=UPI00234E53B5|nr:SET and MYND domain-containing protein 4-like isoform X2 [Mercenaria mercenaria]
MSASIGNFQFELESSLEAAKSAGVFSNLLKDKSEDVILEAFKGHTKIKDIEWIAVYFENCHKLNTKSSEKASCLRNEGNKLFQKKKYREAISKYTHAIISGPTETEELAFAYGNRSAALYRIGLYEECLSDIEEVFSCGSPSALQHKLLQRKAQCMNHLGRTAETNLCLGELQHELEDLDLDADKKGNILSEMAALQDRHELRGNTMKAEKAVEVPEVSYGPNSVLVQASGLVSLNSSKTKGRFLTASKDVKAGDTLIVERPFAAVLLPDHYPTHCHHCFQKLNMAYPCRQCTMVRYCSTVCATLSWDQYHNVECRYLQLLHSVGIAHLSLRVVLVAGCRYLLGKHSVKK